MTLTKYQEAMSRLELSDQAMDRILGNLDKTAPAPAGNVIPFPQWKKYLSAAACFALLLVGVWTFQNKQSVLPPQPGPTEVTIANGIEEVATLEELSRRVGFPVEEVTGLPFAVTETRYTSYWDELAEIAYDGADNTLILRKGHIGEDVSGDYNVYPEEKSIEADGVTITLKGETGAYVLAAWTDGDYAYSLALDQGVPEETLFEMVRGLLNTAS